MATRVLPSSEWSATLQRAGQEAHVVRRQRKAGNDRRPGDTARRGERGNRSRGGVRKTSPETIEMVQAVAQRLALSVENARLYEVTLRSRRPEQRINNIPPPASSPWRRLTS